jgi:hypothetical protein
MRDHMPMPFRYDLIPYSRRGCEVLIESTCGDLDLLSSEQIVAIRRLYFLDSPDSEKLVADLVREGRVLP